MKKCTKCGIEKPLDSFNRDKHSKDGYTYGCIACNRALSRKYENGGSRIVPRKPYSNIIRSSDYTGAIEVKVYGKNDLWFTIDIDDFEKYSDYKFYMSSGYVAITPESRKMLLHRFLHSAEMVDHVNRNKLDNRKSNLRSANKYQNQSNSGPHKRNKLGYKGVTVNRGRSYQSSICTNGTRIYLGAYQTAVEAALAYDEAAKKYHGEFAYLNFPDGVPND
jgi:hypothetical protein